MTVKGSVTFSVVILFALISFPFPAVPQVAPPCCTTPPILEEIALRPQEESLIDFKQWLDDRKHSPNGSSWRSDVSALLGACAQGCPPKYAIARNYLTAQIAPGAIEELMPKRAQTSVREKPRQNLPRAILQPRLAAPGSANPRRGSAQVTSELSPALKNQFLRNLLDWKQEPDQIPRWTQQQLVGKHDNDLVDLDAYLSGRCAPPQFCPANLVIGLQAIHAVREQRHISQQAVQKENERQEAASTRSKDRFLQAVLTIAAAFIGGLLTLAVTVYAQRKSQHESETFRAALKDVLRWSAAQNRAKLPRASGKRIRFREGEKL